MELEERILELFRRQKEHFFGSIASIYPFSEEQIERYYTNLPWWSDDYMKTSGLSMNKNLPWSKEFVDKYVKFIDFETFCSFILGENIWFEGIIDYYKDYIKWSSISCNSHIVWTEELIDKYKDDLDWYYFSISWSNRTLWTEDLIDKYIDYIDWDRFGNGGQMPWNTYNEMRFYPPWFKSQEVHRSLPISESIRLLEKYEDRLDWSHVHIDWRNGLSRKSQDYIVDTFMSELKDGDLFDYFPMSESYLEQFKEKHN